MKLKIWILPQTKGNGETSTVLNIDTALNSSSTNPVQNKVIKKMYDDLVTLINNTKKALEDLIDGIKKGLEKRITVLESRTPVPILDYNKTYTVSPIKIQTTESGFQGNLRLYIDHTLSQDSYVSICRSIQYTSDSNSGSRSKSTCQIYVNNKLIPISIPDYIPNYVSTTQGDSPRGSLGYSDTVNLYLSKGDRLYINFLSIFSEYNYITVIPVK